MCVARYQCLSPFRGQSSGDEIELFGEKIKETRIAGNGEDAAEI